MDNLLKFSHAPNMAKSLDKPQGPTAQWLLDQIEEFLTSNADLDNAGCSFGWHVAKDRMLVSRLRAGGDVTTSRMDDILAFMQDPTTKSRTLNPINIKRRTLP